MIKAPYNFVPLASKVVFPDWASQISIDWPFEDGISGTINVKYTAQTPVFIGNGKGDGKSPIPNYKAANGKYAIPGSSLRGMFRNIIEIASFGKFNRVSDAALSVRDLQNQRLYTNNFTKRDQGAFEAKSKAGWLKQNEHDGKWILYPVEYHRVEDSTLEDCYKRDLRSRNSEERIKKISKKVKIFFKAGLVQTHQHHKNPKTGKPLLLKYSKVNDVDLKQFTGSKPGYTVLTGLCGRKHMDFIFEEENPAEYKPVSDAIIKKFDDVNISNPANQQSGIALRKKLGAYVRLGYPGIPVFYLTKDEKSEEPTSIGLAQMFKLPYKYNLHDAIMHSSEDNFSDRLDFAECMFGKIKNNSKKNSSDMNFSLKGRVQFEDAVSENAKKEETAVDTILNNPKPTYYPNYIEQNVRDEEYKTLMDDDVKLRGWKRYPVRKKENPARQGEDRGNVGTSFCPLKTGAIFEGRIHFHNLKKEELGALLWAITWGGDKNLSHAVGMGKPYGFGQLKAEIDSLSYLENDSEGNEYKLAADDERKNWERFFETYMDSKVVGWAKTSQLKELLAMANPENAERKGWDLQYLSLKDEDKKNQFIEAKKSYSFLAPYSSDKQEMQLSYQNNNWRGVNNNPNYGSRYNVGQNNRVYANSPQKLARSEDGITNGSIQICVLLEEKTKKGGWCAMVKDVPNISGPIVNTAEVPADKNAGDEIKLKIAAVNKVEGMTNFRYEKQ